MFHKCCTHCQRKGDRSTFQFQRTVGKRSEENVVWGRKNSIQQNQLEKKWAETGLRFVLCNLNQAIFLKRCSCVVNGRFSDRKHQTPIVSSWRIECTNCYNTLWKRFPQWIANSWLVWISSQSFIKVLGENDKFFKQTGDGLPRKNVRETACSFRKPIDHTNTFLKNGFQSSSFLRTHCIETSMYTCMDKDKSELENILARGFLLLQKYVLRQWFLCCEFFNSISGAPSNWWKNCIIYNKLYNNLK